MPDLDIRIRTDDLLARFVNAVSALTDQRVRLAEARAINHVGDTAYTAVRKALIEQTSASRALIDEALRKNIAAIRGGASVGDLRYEIVGSGRPIPLREFHAIQFGKGVRAKVWGRLQTFPHTFIVAGAGGQVFVREGKSRLPIRVVYGPSIAKELVVDKSAAAFETATKDFAPRLLHEIDRLFPSSSGSGSSSAPTVSPPPPPRP